THFRSARKSMRSLGGKWEFLFYDREPHDLFGGDVKTRNVIVFHDKRTKDYELWTSSLLKWRSGCRPMIFSRDRAVRADGLDIEHFVPKLSTVEASDAYCRLREMAASRAPIFSEVKREYLANCVGETNESSAVFVGPTAYNFMSVGRVGVAVPQFSCPLSESKVTRLSAENEDDAWLLFGLLS